MIVFSAFRREHAEHRHLDLDGQPVGDRRAGAAGGQPVGAVHRLQDARPRPGSRRRHRCRLRRRPTCRRGCRCHAGSPRPGRTGRCSARPSSSSSSTSASRTARSTRGTRRSRRSRRGRGRGLHRRRCSTRCGPPCRAPSCPVLPQGTRPRREPHGHLAAAGVAAGYRGGSPGWQAAPRAAARSGPDGCSPSAVALVIVVLGAPCSAPPAGATGFRAQGLRGSEDNVREFSVPALVTADPGANLTDLVTNAAAEAPDAVVFSRPRRPAPAAGRT